MAWTAPQDWVAGDVVTAAELNQQVRDNLKTIGDPWTAFTPVWAGGVSAIGNAVVTARYAQSGKWVRGWIHAVFGSSTTFAAADIFITPPVPVLAADLIPIGHGIIHDASVGIGSRAGCVAYMTTSASVRYIELVTGTTGQVLTNTSPFTWTTSDTLAVAFEYEAS